MSKFKRFLKDTSGNYAMMTALMMGPLIGAMALSVDVAEMSRQKAQVQSTLDATNVATARYLLAGIAVDTTKSSEQQEAEREAKVKKYAKDYFFSVLPSVDPEKVTFSTEIPKKGSDDGMKNFAALEYNPYFRPVALLLNGRSDSNEYVINVEAAVSLENTIELALVLDNSGSMKELGESSSKKRIDLLKDASKKLLDRLAMRGEMMKQVEKPVQVSLVPFAGSVNVGANNADKSWMDTEGQSPIHQENFTWPALITLGALKTIVTTNGVPRKVGLGWPLADQTKVFTRFDVFKTLSYYKSKKPADGTLPYTDWKGCVESRPYPLNLQDTPASNTNTASYFVPMFAPDEATGYEAPNDWMADRLTSGSAATRQKDALKYFTPMPRNTGTAGMGVGPNSSCTSNPIHELTDVTSKTGMSAMKSAIDSMQPLGATNVPEGLAWGWRTVSSAEPFTGGRSEVREGNMKVVVVLTDGANTYYTPDYFQRDDSANNKSTYGAYGYAGTSYQGDVTRIFKGTTVSTHSDDTYSDAMNQHFKTLCTNAKAGNVIIMTVALDLNKNDNAEKQQIAALTSCASESRFAVDENGKPRKLFWNSTGKSLEKDFEAIADELSNLRITG